jgi:hypothetical protein
MNAVESEEVLLVVYRFLYDLSIFYIFIHIALCWALPGTSPYLAHFTEDFLPHTLAYALFLCFLHCMCTH